jgi:hypothetical protein
MSPYGLITSRWERQDNGKIKLTVVVPPNSQAKVIVPNKPESSEIPFQLAGNEYTATLEAGKYEIICAE